MQLGGGTDINRQIYSKMTYENFHNVGTSEF